MLVIDCAEVGKAKNDTALVSALADETGTCSPDGRCSGAHQLGYYPVFSFLNSLNGLIDLASVGLIGQKGLSSYHSCSVDCHWLTRCSRFLYSS